MMVIPSTISSLQAGVDYVEDRQRRREDHKLKVQSMQQQMQQRSASHSASMANNEVRLQQLELQLRESRSKIARQESYSAFDMFNADGNPNHLNFALRNNPELKRAYPDTVAVSTISPENPEDAQLLRSKGIQLTDDIDIDKFKRRFVKVTKPDGTFDIADMMQLYAGTGYLDYKDDLTRKRLMDEAQIRKQMYGGSETAMIREALRAAEAQRRIESGEAQTGDEEIVKAFNKKTAASETADAKNSKLWGEVQQRMADGTATEEDKAFDKVMRQKVAGSVPGKLEEADVNVTKLFEAFGGEDNFWATDFNDPRNFRKAYTYVNKIEQLEGSELTNQDKRALEDIRQLVTLGDSASELTNREAGLIDRLFNNVKSYLSNEVGGKEATSAYSAFRNSVRYALFGASLTAAEINSFNEAFGTLGQQTGPVLAQFKTALNQVKSKLETLASFGNPAVAHVRMGTDERQLLSIIQALEERIEALDTTGRDTSPSTQQQDQESMLLSQQPAPQEPSAPTGPTRPSTTSALEQGMGGAAPNAQQRPSIESILGY